MRTIVGMIHTTQTDHAIIISFSGIDELGAPEHDVEERLRMSDILNESRVQAMTEQKRLIIDLQGIRSISPALVGGLITHHKHLKRSGATGITLARVGAELLQFLSVTRVQRVFRFEQDLDTGPDTVGAPVPRPRSPDVDSASAAPPLADDEDY